MLDYIMQKRLDLKMSRLARKLLMMFAVMLMGGLGLVLTSNTYADEGSFKIYAGQSTNFVYTDPLSGISTEYPGGSIEESANVIANGDGTYRVSSDRIFNSYAIELRIEGRSLVISAGSGCLGAKSAKVGFKDSIKDFHDAIQAEIGGQEWLYTCDGGFGNVTNVRVKFSVEDVTDPDKVELPAVATEEELTGGTGGVQTNCINSGAANTLGWIVCPFMDWMGNAAQDLYNGTVKGSLQVEPELFSGDSGGTRQGWETFRNIANVLFIILFLFVIFSQITGLGIDNYGIKKILPKLIISAILINLSYWLCIVFMDLSNIIGNSLQALFNNLAAGLTPSSTIVGPDAFSSAGATIVSVIITGLAVTGVGTVVALNPAVLLTLAVSVIGVVISILFLFILLSVREAAVVVLVVIAPLAVVCYMLPNTKSMFDKWLKFFEGLLLVYPICGLLIGGGNYVSQLLLASGIGDGDIFSAITAMIIGIVPIFFIPTVLRNSFSAMGNIGAKISGIGQRVSGATTGAARNSQAYKNAQEMGRMRQTRIRAGINADGSQKQLGRFGTMIRGGKRNVMRNAAQYLKDRDEIRQAEAFLTDPAAFEAAKIAQERRASNDAVSNWEMLVDDASQNGSNYDTLIGLYRDYMMNGNVDGTRAVARVAGRRKDYAARFMRDAFTGDNAMFTVDANNVRHDYDRNDVAAVANELATGTSSGTYRSASPLGYGFVSQINENPGSANYSYGGENGWQNRENVDSALKAFVTNRSEFAGIKGGEMDKMFELMGGYEDENGAHIDSRRAVMSEGEATRMQSLATDVIENRDKDPIDLTKAEQLAKISGKYRYDKATGNFIPVRNAGVDDGRARDFGGEGESISHD